MLEPLQGNIGSAELWAHTSSSKDAKWPSLRDHLQAVAELSGSLASKFGAEPLGKALRLALDLRMADPRFQTYLKAASSGQRLEKCANPTPSAVEVHEKLWVLSQGNVGNHARGP